MPPCTALTKDAKPCRAYGTSDPSKTAPLCPFHAHFYDSPKALFNIAINNASPYTTIQTFATLTRAFRTAVALRVPDLATHILQRFKDMTTSPDFVERDKALFVYKVVVQAGVIAPLDSPLPWTRAVSNNLMSLRYYIHAPSQPLEMDRISAATQERIGLYFQDIPGLHAVKWFLHETVKSSGWVPGSRPDPVASEAWIRVLDHLLSLTDNRSLAHYDMTELYTKMSVAAKKYPTHSWNLPAFVAAVQALVRREQLIVCAQLRGAIDPFKEELMAVAWHPDRVAAAMAVGLMPEDM